MDGIDSRRLEHAAQMLEKGRKTLATSPREALYSIKSALLLRATTLTRVENSGATAAIDELLEEACRLHIALNEPIAPSERNSFTVLALAIDKPGLARKLIQLPATQDEHPFTVYFGQLLLQALGSNHEPFQSPDQLTSSERLLIEDLRAVIARRSVDLTGTEKFWSSTRKQRFASSIHEYQNFFKLALLALQNEPQAHV
jgi:hypothetical protein